MKTKKTKQYDLEDRTLHFARNVRGLVKILPKTISNIEDGKQLIRSSGSVGANYIEANGALGRKDLIMRLRISRKEASESRFWLNLLDTGYRGETERQRQILLKEAVELISILSVILRKCEQK